MATFFIVTAIVVVIILVIRQANKSQPVITKEKSERFVQNLKKPNLPKDAQDLFDILNQVNANGSGTDQDTIPDGYGEFGLEATNPIPVNSVFGSMEYLRKLRTSDGQMVENIRTGSIAADNIDNPIDQYELSVNGHFLTNIYISPYHKKNSERAPKGFKLSPIPFL